MSRGPPRPPHQATDGAGSASDGVGWPQPPGCPPLATARRLTSADAPTAALRCTATTEVVAGDGEYEVAVNERATQGLAGLLTALRLPDAPPPAPNTACTAMATQNWVVLEIGGRPVTIATPVDECAHRLRAVDTALEGLRWQEVSRTRGAKVRGIAAVEAQCDSWKDLFTYTRPEPATAGPALSAQQFKVCLLSATYPADYVDDGQHGVDGVPVGGRTLTGTDAERVRALLAASTPTSSKAACSARHTRFAVVLAQTAEGSGDYASVELDGCRRVMDSSGRVSQAPPDLIPLLLGS